MKAITATEIMICDWVLDTTLNTPHRINAQDMYVAAEGILKLDAFQPIPLTPEILAKNGWEEDNIYADGTIRVFRQTFIDDLYSTTEIRIDQDCYDDMHLMHEGKHFCFVNYVHQLQHALRLCQINKEIVL